MQCVKICVRYWLCLAHETLIIGDIKLTLMPARVTSLVKGGVLLQNNLRIIFNSWCNHPNPLIGNYLGVDSGINW